LNLQIASSLSSFFLYTKHSFSLLVTSTFALFIKSPEYQKDFNVMIVKKEKQR